METTFQEEIDHAVLVRAEVGRVWDALTTGAGIDGWFTSGSVVTPERIIFRWKEWGPKKLTFEDGGPVLEMRRHERFAFQWSPDDPSYTTTVTIDFEPSEEGTIVHVRERGYRKSPKGLRSMLDCACGWGEALALMKMWVEHGVRY